MLIFRAFSRGNARKVTLGLLALLLLLTAAPQAWSEGKKIGDFTIEGIDSDGVESPEKLSSVEGSQFYYKDGILYLRVQSCRLEN
jgi:hypothetical protein